MQQVPAALSITFGIREFARLAAAVEPATLSGMSISRAHALVEQARELRGLLLPVAPEADCVPDPMGGSPEVQRNAAEVIRSAVQSIVERVVPPDHGSSAPS